MSRPVSKKCLGMFLLLAKARHMANSSQKMGNV